jgi:hypothetical protein
MDLLIVGCWNERDGNITLASTLPIAVCLINVHSANSLANLRSPERYPGTEKLHGSELGEAQANHPPRGISGSEGIHGFHHLN